MRNKVSAIIVTYNRLDFLIQTIQSLKNQTRKPDTIIVVNNSSTDGTSEWLNTQSDLIVIYQENIGSSGGQYSGIKYAYDNDSDWIWVMDDDVFPENDCLEKLLENINENKIIAPIRYSKDGKIFFNEAISYNLKNPFKSFWNQIFSEYNLGNRYIYAEGITFEGPIFHSSLIDKIGLPEKQFFIYGDDTEFFIRAKKAGFEIMIDTQARFNRLLPYSPPESNFSWKNYYIIRNIIAIDVLHGNLAVRLIRPFRYLIKWLFSCKNFKDIITVLKAFKNGYFYKSSNVNSNKTYIKR